MNIDTIKKYKNEFDHFVNGGKLLWARARDSKLSWLKATGNHQEFFNTNEEYYIYIIDDEYVEFRKALAEGKTIEYIGQSSNVWHEVQEPDFNLHPNCYRIKPDEPKFKVGDFVRYIHSTPAKALEINNINGNRYYFTNSEMSCLKHELELWTPVKGEWCWFWDKPNSKYGTLTKFHSLCGSKFKSDNCAWTYCAPFIGKLPPHLKD